MEILHVASNKKCTKIKKPQSPSEEIINANLQEPSHAQTTAGKSMFSQGPSFNNRITYHKNEFNKL